MGFKPLDKIKESIEEPIRTANIVAGIALLLAAIALIIVVVAKETK